MEDCDRSTPVRTQWPFVPHPRPFYEPSALHVAPRLLGQYLLRSTPEGICGGLIVETEAYLSGDPASHAFARETTRNRAMWGDCGHAYVYFIYGRYCCFNAVCRPAGSAEAVLVRALQPTHGLAWMQRRRPGHSERHLASGPGKLCDALQIDRALDGVNLCDAASPLCIAANPQPPQERIVVTTRVGIMRAARWPLRYFYEGGRYISRGVLRGHEFHVVPAPDAATEYSRRRLRELR